MKHHLLTIILLFILCCENIHAQHYIEINPFLREKTTNKILPQINPMQDWQKNWTKESVLAINEIIKEYGYPDENCPRRMHWIIPGETKTTITVTEKYSYSLPTGINLQKIGSQSLSLESN